MKPYPFAPLNHFTVPFSFTTDSFQPCKRNSAHPEMRTAAGPCHRKQPKRKSGFQRIFIRGDRWMEKRLESGLDEDYFAADCTSTYPYFHCRKMMKLGANWEKSWRIGGAKRWKC